MMKKVLSVILSMVMVVGTLGMTGVNDSHTVFAATNVALGKKVTCSSYLEGYEPTYAVDESKDTKWVSKAADNQYITVDLGKEYIVGTVILLWGEEYPSEYSVYWAGENGKFQEAVIWGGAANAERIHMMYNRSIRYIRIKCNERGTTQGISLYDLQVMA